MTSHPTPPNTVFDNLEFDNTYVRTLPPDPDTSGRRRQVYGACFSRVLPTPVAQPAIVAWSPAVAELLGLPPEVPDTGEWAEVFAGNRVLAGMEPYAACYGGHQFGHWAGQLGDGRAITLGELVNARGERWELQLKGAGPTPYSRTADGRAVLRSSIREFLCSEAMHHLGVPTTRALSLVETGEPVLRDMLYDGNPRMEPGAVVCRVAPSFLRFGSFEIFTARGDLDVLEQLARYAVTTHFAHLLPEGGTPDRATYTRFFEEVCRRTADMIVEWMRVGFVHGVMNTDNMSILGLTIDYGPYGWVDDYDPNWTPNTTDAQGRRYRFGHQPQVALWNLAQLGSALHPLVGAVEPLEEALDVYRRRFDEGFRAMMAAKLGLTAFEPDTDLPLVEGVQRVLQLTETDMTIFYRRLASVDVERADALPDAELVAPLAEAYYQPDALATHTREIAAWLRAWAARARRDGLPHDARRARMNATNPKYVLRNYLAQLAIDAAEDDDHSLVHELLDVMRRPYDEQPDREQYAARRPDWARNRPGSSMLSCSS